MDARSSAIDSCLQLKSLLRGTAKIPCKFIRISSDLLQIPEFVFLPVMPKHRFAKEQPERHFVYQRFQRAGTCAGSWKVRMSPSPEFALPVSTVVSLNSETQRFPIEPLAIQGDLTGKYGVRMRGTGKSNPTLIAQRPPKGRTVLQIPGNRMPLNFQRALARSVIDMLIADLEVEGSLAPAAEIDAV